MKKIYIFIFLLLSCFSLNAQERVSLAKKVVAMERLRSAGRLLEAMDTATLILTYDRDYRAAVDFVYRNWDKTMQMTEKELSQLNDEQSLEQAQRRCDIYRVLDEVYDNLRQVRMPLYGPNQKWVWQPEIGYYTGHYDDERHKTFNLLLRKAEEAMKSFDAEGAAECYRLILNKYLIDDYERKSNMVAMLTQCNTTIDKYCDSDKIFHAIFCYDLCNLSIELDSNQPLIKERQVQIQHRISALYLEQAEAAMQAGDTIQANELRLSAQDWQYISIDEDR